MTDNYRKDNCKRDIHRKDNSRRNICRRKKYIYLQKGSVKKIYAERITVDCRRYIYRKDN